MNFPDNCLQFLDECVPILAVFEVHDRQERMIFHGVYRVPVVEISYRLRRWHPLQVFADARRPESISRVPTDTQVS